MQSNTGGGNGLGTRLHQPIAFSQLWSLMRWFKPVYVTPFLHLYTCTPVWMGHKWTLNLEPWTLATIHNNNCWSRAMVGVFGDRERLSSIVDEQTSSQWLFSQYCIYIYWGSLWGQTCFSVLDGKLQRKHTPAARKSDINKTNKIVLKNMWCVSAQLLINSNLQCLHNPSCSFKCYHRVGRLYM